MRRDGFVPTRRALLGAGAVGAGAAALRGLAFDPALAEAPAAGGETGGAPTVGPAAIPPTIPGARVFHAIGLDAVVEGGATMTFSIGAYSSSGVLRVPIDVPSGARVQRVDVTFYRSASGSSSIEVWSVPPDATGFDELFTVTTASGTGLVQGSNTIPFVVAPGAKLYARAGSTSATNQLSRVVVTYFDPIPQLVTLSTPARVYDSRAGFAPLGVTKGKLANGNVRVIDCKLGGQVPTGASSVLVNLTVTATSPAGFLALFRNGVAWPGTSSINWDHAIQTIATTTLVATDQLSRIAARVHTGSSCDFVIDVLGYYI